MDVKCLLSCLFMLNMLMGGLNRVFILSSQMMLRLFAGSCGAGGMVVWVVVESARVCTCYVFTCGQ